MYIRYEYLPDFPKNSVVKNIVFNPKMDIITFIVSSNSVWLRSCEYQLDFPSSQTQPVFNLNPPFFNERIAESLNIQWTYEGKYLFCVQGKGLKSFILNRSLDQFNLVSNSYKEDSSEILCLGSSRDEKYAFYGTLDGRLVKMSTVSPKKEEQKFNNKILSLLVDPLMKFVGVLTLENKFVSVDFNSLNPLKTVDLNLNKQNQELIIYREERKIDMSPNLTYILIPNLDDKKLPIIYAIHRESFELKYIYGGSFASINCIKFLPKIFYQDDFEFNYFAFGDAHGNIAFWEISNELTKKNQPLCLLKSDDVTITIESIDFSRDGNLMVAVTNKRFFIMVVLSKYVPLQKTRSISKYDFINENCGEFDFRHFEIKSYTDGRKTADVDAMTSVPVVKEPVRKLVIRRKNDEVAKPVEVKPEAVVVEETVTDLTKVGVSTNSSSTGGAFSVKIRSMELFAKSGQVLIDGEIIKQGSRFLQYSELEGFSEIKKFSQNGFEWSATFEGMLVYILANEELVIVYSQDSFLYFLDFVTGRRVEMKMNLNYLHSILLDNESRLLIVKNNGSIMLFDFNSRCFLFKKSLTTFLENKTRSFKNQKEFEDFVAKNEVLSFLLSNENGLEIFYFGNKISFDLENSKWQSGHISEQQNTKADSIKLDNCPLSEYFDYEISDPIFNLLDRNLNFQIQKA